MFEIPRQRIEEYYSIDSIIFIKGERIDSESDKSIAGQKSFI